jgi:O-methyltransferase
VSFRRRFLESMILKNAYVQRMLGGGWVERIGIRMASLVEYLLLCGHKDPTTLRTLRRARRERKTLVTFNEAFMVQSLAKSVVNVPGDIAEIGVFEGSTAKLLCELKAKKRVHLFDTFAGLPPGTTPKEKIVYAKTKYRCSLESVSKYLAGYENVQFYRGFFPESAVSLDPELRFSFVHMDVDLYQSTLDCLKLFYPRMNPGGIMLSHDYSILDGVEQAFREFLHEKPEQLIELPTTQCLLVRR